MATGKTNMRTARAVWLDYEKAEAANDIASVAGDLNGVEAAMEAENAAYHEFALLVPVTRADILLKLEQCARWIRAAEGSDHEWPGMEGCARRLLDARDAIGRGIKDVTPLAAVRTVWRELVDVWGADHIDTVMIQTTMIGISKQNALRLVK